MAFAILRTQKLKSSTAVQRSMKHAFRAQETPNADPERTPENTHIGAQDVDQGMTAFQSRLPDKFRKDAVQCIEYLVTGSPEGMATKGRGEQDAYFADALTWLRERHGAENVVYAGIHRDETTPHMYAYVVPRDGEKLNAKKWLGGAKALSEMQTEFVERVGKHHGLQRGVERSKAEHKPIRQFYAEMQASQAMANKHGTVTIEDLTPRKLKAQNLTEKIGLATRIETPEMVAQRLSDRFRPIILEADQVNRENKRLKGELADVAAKLKSFMTSFGTLTRDQLTKLVSVAMTWRKEATDKREAERLASRERSRDDRGMSR